VGYLGDLGEGFSWMNENQKRFIRKTEGEVRLYNAKLQAFCKKNSISLDTITKVRIILVDLRDAIDVRNVKFANIISLLAMIIGFEELLDDLSELDDIEDFEM
jgi:hypothetical protein